MTKSKIVIALASCLFLMLPAFGDIIEIDFTGPSSQEGTLTDIDGVYTGTNIPISDMTATVGGNALGPYAVSGTCWGNAGCLNFSTGTGTNSITIVGAVTNLNVNSTTLLSGTISSFSYDVSQNRYTFTASGPDSKDSGLLSALHIPLTADFNYAQTEVGVDSNHKVTGSKVKNTASVPDGGVSAMLLAGALLGIETLRRKMRV